MKLEMPDLWPPEMELFGVMSELADLRKDLKTMMVRVNRLYKRIDDCQFKIHKTRKDPNWVPVKKATYKDLLNALHNSYSMRTVGRYSNTYFTALFYKYQPTQKWTFKVYTGKNNERLRWMIMFKQNSDGSDIGKDEDLPIYDHDSTAADPSTAPHEIRIDDEMESDLLIEVYNTIMCESNQIKGE